MMNNIDILQTALVIKQYDIKFIIKKHNYKLVLQLSYAIDFALIRVDIKNANGFNDTYLIA